jgi:hypothetical protein
MNGVPVVGAAAAFAGEVRPDAPGAEKHRSLELVLIFLGFGHRAPAAVFIRNGPHKLAMAVPAGFAHIGLAANAKGIGGRLVEPGFAGGVGLFRGSIRRKLAEGGLERLWEAFGEVFKLIPHIRVHELLCGFLRLIAIHEYRHNGLRNKRQPKEEDAGDEKGSGPIL